MKSPELLIADDAGREESLRSFETQDFDDINLDIIAAHAWEALDGYILEKSTGGLAELHSLLTGRALTLVESGMPVAEAVSSTLRGVRERVQRMYQSGGTPAFKNEDIFAVLGRDLESSIESDIGWLSREMGEALPENQTRQIYTNGMLDDRYAIDFLEAIWTMAPDGELVLDRVDLVQTKRSGAGVSLGKRDDILRKHRDFLAENQAVIAELKSIDATDQQIQDLTSALGEEVERYLGNSFEEAITGPESNAEPYMRSALDLFKDNVLSNKAFVNASKAVKRAYVEHLSFSNEDISGDALASSLGAMFDDWKKEWLSSIGDRKKRVLSPVKALVTRSVIAFGDEPAEIEVISDLTKDAR